MNILIIGGAGYIGSHCVRQLEILGHRAVVLDNFVTGHRQAIDPSIEVIALNAEGDGNRQIAQGEAVLAQGVKAIVINTIGETTAVPIVKKAELEGVPVIAYDGLMSGVVTQGYVSFNNQYVGELQAQWLVDNLPKGANVAIINGEQFCDACRAFRTGAHKVLDTLDADGTINIVVKNARSLNTVTNVPKAKNWQ